MRKSALFLVAALAGANPALADTRVEARGGLVSIDGTGEPILGVAAGIDFDLAPMVFSGVELSSDKVDTGGGKTSLGVTGRLGVKFPTGTRLFATGGYSSALCNLCDDRWHAGAGVQQKVAGPVYLKGEYRHFFATSTALSTDAVFAGVGVSF